MRRSGRDAPTGVYFEEQTVESVMEGILQFEAADALGALIRRRFGDGRQNSLRTCFCGRIREFVLEKVPEAEAQMAPEATIDVGLG